MLKLIKWNSIDFGRKYLWLFIGMAASLLLAVLPENSKGSINGTMALLSAVLGIVLFQAGIAIAMTYCFRWLEKDSSLLELSLPASAWQTLLGKLVVSLAVNGLSCLFMLQLFLFIGKYSGGSIQLLNLDNLRGIPGLLLFFMTIDCTVLFSFLVTKSLRLKRGVASTVTCLLSLIILGAIIAVMISLMTAAGVLTLPTFSSQGVLKIGGTLEILSTTIPLCVLLSTIVLEYIASGLLLNRR
ncbi:hypothetical protein LARV_01139 [Longilinea arvoryzae]|uniref:ABC-2 family transporter protein n=1 Tax=Longilinea arvoryzae TaxID=360412 RepID=A0A0S7BIF1_9CHLR|nr:hypothetical protein [Longilinea arvoryzae]GAP13386.1 hypothetical protein LARV_01139 [Longilinea arvoryzae]